MGHCKIKVPDTQSAMPQEHEYEHVVHPATLETVFQTFIPAMTALNENLNSAKVPTNIEKLYVSADMHENKAGSLLEGYSTSDALGFRESEASAVIFATENGSAQKKPLVIAEKIRCTSLATTSEGFASEDEPGRNLALKLSWKEHVDTLDQTPACPIYNAAANHLEQADPLLIEELELAAFIYTKRVLKAYTPNNARFFAPHLQRYYEYMQ